MDKIAIIYWSGTGNTEAMANGIAQGAKDAGAEVDLFDVAAAQNADLGTYSKLVFGCPSMGDEVLEEDEFEPFFTGLEGSLSGKKVALFGSYGWGDGEWMRNWVERTKGLGANLYGEGLIVNEAPEGDECAEYGKAIAQF